jgi:hypothetical protein
MDQTEVDFTATLITYSISGTILDTGGLPISGVSVSDGLAQTVLTDDSGSYTLTDLPPGSYTITPSLDWHTFVPEFQEIVISAESISGVNFTGEVLPLPEEVPQLISPPNKTKTNNNDVLLKWTAVQDKVSYKLQVSTDPDFINKVVKYTTEPGEGVIVITHELPDFEDGKYYWRVRAIDAEGVKGPWSEVWKFKVDTKPPSIPSLYTPANNAFKTDTTPTLSVYAASGAKYYHFQVANDNEFIHIVSQSDDRAGTSWTVPVELTYGEYYWRVKSIDAATNESNWSSVRKLTITFQKLPTYGAVTSDKTPTFEWRAVPGAANYRLIIDRDRTGEYDRSIDILPPLVSYTLPKDNKLAAAKYYWMMEVQIDTEWVSTPWRLLTITP